MKVSAAGEYLGALRCDRDFERTIDSRRDRKIVDALLSVGDEMPANTLSQIVGKIARSESWTLLFDAARKGPADPAGKVIAAAIGKRRELSGQFFKHALALRAGAEAAELVVDLAKSPHLPSLIKRLAKHPPPSKAMVEAAKRTLSAKPTKAWFDLVNFLTCCGLLGVLIKNGTPSAMKIVDDVGTALERQLGSHEIHQPAETIDRLRKSLGANPGKKKTATKNAAASNPAVELANAQEFSVMGNGEWRAKLWLAKGEPNEWFGAHQKETQLLLTLNAKSKPHWSVTVRAKRGHDMYSNTAGRVMQDDFGLPPLKRLDDVPSWLGRAAKKLKTSFTATKAKISAGRQRKLVAELRSWLADPEGR